MKSPLVPISWGDLIDKITILEIKKSYIKDADALKNIHNEFEILNFILLSNKDVKDKVKELKKDLSETNLIIWHVEDRIREKESQKLFNEGFIELARMVYVTNDRRAEIKRQINYLHNSEIIEEKSYHK